MYGTIAYYNGAATNAVENQINAVADPDIAIQSNAFVFTGNYRLLADAALGASVTRGRFFTPEWAGRGQPTIFSQNRSATPPSNTYYDLYTQAPLVIPQAQQVAAYLTNNAGAPEKEAVLVQYGSAGWNRNIPPGKWDIMLHATATATLVAGAWVENTAIAFDSPPLGGVYLVLGAQVVCASCYAYRWVFPRAAVYNGRRMRPGDVVLAAAGNVPPIQLGDFFRAWGVQGLFWTFEQPTIGLLGQTAGAQTADIFMMCRFMGEDPGIMDSLIGQLSA